MKYDLIIGNPPFQAPTDNPIKRAGGLWFKFVKKSAEMLKPGGMMAFVSPRWTGIGYFESKSWRLGWFKQFHVSHICFDAKEHFPSIGSSICWYVLKEGSTGMTKVMDWDGEIDLNKIDALPFNVTPMNITILNKILRINNGSTYSFANGDWKNEGLRKVYIINGRFVVAKHIKIDEKGDTEDKWKTSMPLEINEIEGARSVFTSKLAHYVWNIMGAPDGMSQNGILSRCMPIVDLTKVWTDDELYQWAHLTDNEIKYIEESLCGMK